MRESGTVTDLDPPWSRNPLYGGMSPENAQRSWEAAEARRSRTAPVLPTFDDPPPPSGPDDYGGSKLDPDLVDEGRARRFQPVLIDDVQLSGDPSWLIHRVLPARGLALTVGPPKSGKSFVTTDMLFAPARGVPYGGRKTLAGPVFYCTGEGVTGFKRRLVAMRRHYGVEGQGVPFCMIENVPDMGSEKTDVGALVRAIDDWTAANNWPAPRAIALDTLARCMGEGDENQAKDMGRFVARCGDLERRYGCLIVVVHHQGKNLAAGARGSNALNGAADVTMMVEKGDAYSTVRIEEMKDGPEGQEWRFRLSPFHLEGGEKRNISDPPETSTETSTCIVELLSQPSEAKQADTKKAKAPKGVNGDLLKVIKRTVEEAGKEGAAGEVVAPKVRAASRADLKSYCAKMDWQDPKGKPDGFRTVLNRGLSTLRDAGLIGYTAEWVWLT